MPQDGGKITFWPDYGPDEMRLLPTHQHTVAPWHQVATRWHQSISFIFLRAWAQNGRIGAFFNKYQTMGSQPLLHKNLWISRNSQKVNRKFAGKLCWWICEKPTTDTFEIFKFAVNVIVFMMLRTAYCNLGLQAFRSFTECRLRGDLVLQQCKNTPSRGSRNTHIPL